MTLIEHLNITVPDIDAAVEFFAVVAPDFSVRKDERSTENQRWVHIGNEQHYFALQEPRPDADSPIMPPETYKNFGINHIGLIVNDLDLIKKKLVTQEYIEGINTPVEQFRKRLYFYDRAGFEWELIEYLSSNPTEMYFYET